MKWNERYTNAEMPEEQQISAFVGSPLWQELCAHLQTRYGVLPKTEYSVCPGAPGWNVKYKKSGRALCTLYPNDGFFICLVSVGSREMMAAELLLPVCSETVRELYRSTKPFNGSRWLMIPVTTPEILEDVKRLIGLRVAKSKG